MNEITFEGNQKINHLTFIQDPTRERERERERA